MDDTAIVVFIIIFGGLALLSFFYPDALWAWQKFKNDSRYVPTMPKPESWKADQQFNGVVFLIILAAALIVYFYKR